MPKNNRPPSEFDWLNRPLAIVGMACRLPGADGLEQYWRLLAEGGYAIERMPDAKLDRSRYYDAAKGVRGKTYSDVGGFVTERELDWSLLNISRDEAADWDECHLNLCEVAAKAFRHAGYDPRNLPNRNAGVFVGHSGGSTLGGELAYRTLVDDYLALMDELPQWQELGNDAVRNQLQGKLNAGRPKRLNGRPLVDAGFASGIISKALGLNGPHMSIDAACASSLVALSLGAMSLQSGQTDVAVVGGASFNKSDSLILFSNAQSCSATSSRPFDQAADGLVSSEGYIALVLKTLERALEDGDHVQAVLRGIGVSSDGRGRSLWAPRKEGQVAAIERAYSSDVTPDSVQMIEAHATSTQVGDATEMEALASFYGKHLAPGQRLPVGSVKSNIGHTLETAGLAGVLKSVLSIRNGVIPPSVNVDSLSGSIPWDDIPLYVATSPQLWPELPVGQARRAAVNAFGIGGLNVHVVVDQFLPESANHIVRKSSGPVTQMRVSGNESGLEPVAVIGRGLVLPGASDVEAFGKLLTENRSAITPMQGDRIGLANCSQDFSAGFISDFEYDWRKHKVPPKQIAQANPLQFMLLEAAEQALGEAGLLVKEFDRARTGVVVGSVFGGDFGNALFAGLRLPEFREHLVELLAGQGVAKVMANEFADRYEERFLKVYPALLDETGSFTSSTLASRLAKTFNLMGGALAIDAGDTSSLAALDAACHLLHSGTVGQVLCAGAQRALDRAATENLKQLGRLAGSRNLGAGYPVGEGVVLLVLKRYRDAVRDGDKIYASIDAVAGGFDSNSLSTSIDSASQRLGADASACGQYVGAVNVSALDSMTTKALVPAAKDLQQSPNLPLTGSLQAAQGLVDIVTTSLNLADTKQPTAIASHTLSGQSYIAVVRPTDNNPISDDREVNTTMLPVKAHSDNSAVQTWRFEADDLESLKKRLLLDSSGSDEHVCSFLGGAAAKWRAAIVGTAGEFSGKLTKLVSLIGNESAVVPAREQGLLWTPPVDVATRNASEIAWLFPGQGSQYTGMLSELVQSDAVARQAYSEANAALAELGEPSFEQLAWESQNQLGEDVWQTQASVLVADWILGRTLQGRNIQPTIVCGHSFGEIPAMLFAGCWDLKTALVATWHRCKCIVENVDSGFAMLSVQAGADTVQAAIDRSQLALTISHKNSPTQTVVGGKQHLVAQLAQQLEDDGVASRLLAVPTAFHTPALEAAVAPFRRSLEELSISPPRIPLLSSVNNRFVADPELIRDGLAEQLVRPVDFVGLLQRLDQFGAGVVFEVGPHQVLSRLARDSSDSWCVVPTDSAKNGAMFQLQVAVVASELSGVAAPSTQVFGVGEPVTRTAIVHFDATKVRRQRLKDESGHRRLGSTAIPRSEKSAPLHFDATESRRLERRMQSGGGSRDAGQTEPTAKSKESTSRAQHANSQSDLREPNKSLREIELFLVDFVVEQTGYPAEMIQLDWDIEADLGIDSIKKAQLFGELREFFDIESHTGLKLDDFRTLRDIAQLLQLTPGKGDWLASPDWDDCGLQTGEDTASKPWVASEAGQDESREELRKFLVDFVVEQTGYPAEIVQLDSDLEADLGIDSIKMAQLMGELQEIFGAKVEIGRNVVTAGGNDGQTNLSSLRTLADILDVLTTAKAATTVQEPASSRDVEIATESLPNSPDATGSDRLSEPQLRSFLVDFVVEQTGYPPEIIEMDSDLEADLGIDSIKKAQLFGELRELFSLSLDHQADSSIGLTQIRTLSDILSVLLTQQSRGDSPKSSSSTSLPHQPHTRSLKIEQVIQGAISHEVPDIVYPEQFTLSVQNNVRAMAGRRQDGAIRLESSANGVDEQSRLRIAQLAKTTGMHEASIAAFDRLVLEQVSWHLRESRSSIGAAAIAVDGAAMLAAPQWLLSTGKPIETLQNRSSQCTEFVVPGSVSPLAIVNQHSILCVVGTDSAHRGAIQRQLSGALSALATIQFESIEEVFLKWKINGDWWLSFSDSTKRRARVLRCSAGNISCDDVPFSSFSAVGVADRESVFVGYNDSQAEFQIAGLAQSDDSCQVATDNKVHRKCEASNVEDVAGDGGALNSIAVGRSTQPENPTTIASRYILRMAPTPLIEANGRNPQWSGTALLVGDNPIAYQLEARLKSVGVETVRFSGTDNPEELAERFLKLSKNTVVSHLFLLTPCDPDAAVSLDGAAWQARRNKGVFGNFWLCQKWIQHIVQHDIADEASLIAVSSLGGDFGIRGGLTSAEGGGIGGMLKSILIESWMQGYRSLPIKTIDTHKNQSPAEIVNNVWQELANPSYDNEISYIDGIRHTVRAIQQEVPSRAAPIETGGTWVCTGGARGITAFVAEKLASQYSLTLHLLGTAPVPAIKPEWRDVAGEDLRQLKVDVMTSARKQGLSPVRRWQDTEKALEIDATLRRFASMGIDVHYHSCDVSDRDQVAQVLDRVREISGPIDGILHGAGVGRDSRFDRKQPEKVQQCIAAKVDGALALMDATRHDPLKYFVGFGSISGRFGANGHTDYSLANEMLCKVISWFGKQRPEVTAVGFHWHAWGDVGMATKPETKLALEMIDMQFMPAEEGFVHLVNELESGAGEGEVLITDDRYYRMFYPAETIVDSHANAAEARKIATPLLKCVSPDPGLGQTFAAMVDPVKDPFLSEHLLDGKPLLPFVVAAEMLLEAGKSHLNSTSVRLRNMEAQSALRFFHEDSCELRIESKRISDSTVSVKLLSDFVARDGRVVDKNRVNFVAEVELAEEPSSGSALVTLGNDARWSKVQYPSPDAKFFVGWPLQRLRKVSLSEGVLVGQISAPALIELAGSSRDVRGWNIPSAAMDACLFAAGILAWQQVGPGAALPVRFGSLNFGRLPKPGEACEVHVQLKSSGTNTASFDFALYGVDGRLLIDARDYEVVWLASDSAKSAVTTTGRTPLTNKRG